MNEIEVLKEQWLATRSFDDEQQYLWARVQQGDVPCVEMNPSGDWSDEWLAVIVRRPTGVVYMHQVGGIACHHYLVEGFMVMIGAYKYEPASSGALIPIKLDTNSFIDVFHEGKHCVYGVPGNRLPAERLEKLRCLVADVNYPRCDGHSPGEIPPYRFRLDESRIDEMIEAWIPVDTVDGPGVLLYQNCD
jgi:hypothetical protein